jgi:mono/diheme cytochrome c family protein
VQSWRNLRGAEIPYDLAQSTNLRNPLPRTPNNVETSKRLYQVNCSMCHGREGKGNGMIANYFEAYGATKPIDFSRAETKRLPEGQIWWTVTNGRGNMPSFKGILSEDERWLLTHFVRDVQ